LNAPAESFVEPARVADLGWDYPTVNLEQGECIIVLKTKPDSKDCMFLEGTEGSFRCRIYSHRPTPCKTYPFKLNEDYTISCKPHSVCPRPPSLDDAFEEGRLRDALMASGRALAAYRLIAREWNRTRAGASFQEFLEFIFNPGGSIH